METSLRVSLALTFSQCIFIVQYLQFEGVHSVGPEVLTQKTVEVTLRPPRHVPLVPVLAQLLLRIVLGGRHHQLRQLRAAPALQDGRRAQRQS